jgi:hypothetical protein
MQKDAAILSALDYLRHRLGHDSFKPSDHWAADRTAVGIAHPADPACLVYIAYSDQTSPRYTAILERRSPSGIQPPFEDCGRFNELDLEGLVAVVSAHLRSGHSQENP